MRGVEASDVVRAVIRVINARYDGLVNVYNAMKSLVYARKANIGEEFVRFLEEHLDFLLENAKEDKDEIIEEVFSLPSSLLYARVEAFILKCQVYSLLLELYTQVIASVAILSKEVKETRDVVKKLEPFSEILEEKVKEFLRRGGKSEGEVPYYV